jgi:hypothetical protein
MSASLLRLHLWAGEIPEPLLAMMRRAQGGALIYGKPSIGGQETQTTLFMRMIAPARHMSPLDGCCLLELAATCSSSSRAAPDGAPARPAHRPPGARPRAVSSAVRATLRVGDDGHTVANRGHLQQFDRLSRLEAVDGRR